MARERSRGCLDWLIYADFDWETISQKPKEYCPGIAGAAFGAGWWCWVDAFVHGATVRHQSVPITYHIPGWVATAALVIMNLTSRTQLSEMDDSYEDDSSKTGARACLFLSYLMAFGAVAGSIAVLITCVQNDQLINIGVGGVLQCGLILLGALLLWAFRTSDAAGYGY